jgi:hypothetical protein
MGLAETDQEGRPEQKFADSGIILTLGAKSLLHPPPAPAKDGCSMTRVLAVLVAIMLTIAGIAELATWLRSRSLWTRYREELVHEVESGSLPRLLKAKALANRILAGKPDRDTQAVLAMTNAFLASTYGLPTGPEAQADIDACQAASSGTPRRNAVLGAAQAMVAMASGDLPLAQAHAQRAAEATRGEPYPLLALAMVNARSGAMVAANKLLEALMVREPGLNLAVALWAEVRLDLGDAESARPVLRALVARAPDNTRARLLLSEAERALGSPVAGSGPEKNAPSAMENAEATSLAMACARDAGVSPAIAAACELDAAAAARLAGLRGKARTHALRAAAVAAAEPRVLATNAQILAQLGQIDAAAKLAEDAARFAGPMMPALAWARLGIGLGRGGVEVMPPTLRVSSPDTRLFAARAAFAAGGASNLATFLAQLKMPRAADPDLDFIARCAPAKSSNRHARLDSDDEAELRGPVGAYVAGVLARLDGDPHAAANRLRLALDGHGDACRAAGEYQAALRALKRPLPPEAEFRPLQVANALCINLPPH